MTQADAVRNKLFHNRKQAVICACLLFLLCGCGNIETTVKQTEQQTEQEIGEEREDQGKRAIQKAESLYQEYLTALLEIDTLRMAIPQFPEEAWKDNPDVYSEVIEESFYGQSFENKYTYYKKPPGEYMRGMLTAGRSGAQKSGMRIAMFAEKGCREYVYYPSEEMIYFASYGADKENGDMPEYQICDNVLRYYMYYDCDSETVKDWGYLYPEAVKEWKSLYQERQQAQIGSNIYEYCVIGGRIYAIDRENSRMQDVTETSAIYTKKWLEWEYERVIKAMPVTPQAKEKLVTLIPKPYLLSETAVCDLNKDGIEDYVAGLYIPEISRADNDDYSLRDPDQSMWLFLSDKNGGYKSKILTENGYYCGTLSFTAYGILMSENVFESGKYYPWKRDYFRYDPITEDFYFIKSLQYKTDGIVENNMEDIGFYTIHDFYPGGASETAWNKEYKSEVMENGRKYYVEYDVVYRNQDKRIEDLVREELFQTGKALAEAQYSQIDGDEEGNEYRRPIHFKTTYQNASIFSGLVYGRGSDYKAVLIDTELGKVLDITQMISKEKMLEICKKGMKDKRRDPISAEETEKYLELIQDRYENANSKTPMSNEEVEKSGMCFEITAWGIRISFIGDGEFMLDKEYFMDTALWKYMEPDFS